MQRQQCLYEQRDCQRLEEELREEVQGGREKGGTGGRETANQ